MVDTVYVVDTGLAITTNRLKNGASGATEPNYIGWGTGATAAATTDAALETPAAEARVAGTSSLVQTSTANDTYQVVGTVTCAGSGKAITEVGLFDASSGGNMFLHATFSAINVSVGDSIQFTLKAQYNQA